MEENKMLPVQLTLAPQQLSKSVLVAFFNRELVKKQYQKILQGLQNTKPDAKNLLASQQVLKSGNKFLKEWEVFRKVISDPYKDAQKLIIQISEELVKPIETELDVLAAEIKTVDAQVSADLAREAAEKNRIETIQAAMNTFINNATMFITTATTDTQIVNIQKRIGSEKSRDNFYQEFLTEFKTKCDALTPLINERKGVIKKGKELLLEQEQALKKGDAERAAEIKEDLEIIETEMEENTLRMQEEAFNQASSNEVIVAESMIEGAKGRHLWRWELVDINLLYKKNPELVLLVPNKEAIDKFLSQNREQWKSDGITEKKMNGIKFFVQKYI
jgi:hypothetical protein